MSCEKDVNLDYLIGEWNYYSKDSRVIVDSGTDMEFVDGENVLVKFWDMKQTEFFWTLMVIRVIKSSY